MNSKLLIVDKVREYLFCKGFSSAFIIWNSHSESFNVGQSSRNFVVDNVEKVMYEAKVENSYIEMVMDILHLEFQFNVENENE
ncbi:Uncharacterized protein TCM_003036 [Theobroma cacao]|uniref:Uncharacterized protein n=1 Tax=Theobroma cacao TaxID=3641 RepID=A0A061DMR9_THECC|nr:Uncharacterized protein TCM_003036 [Theobroma cacao]